MSGDYSSLSSLGYGIAGVAQLLLFLFIVIRLRKRFSSAIIAAAALATSLWAATISFNVINPQLSVFEILILDLIQNALWLVFLSAYTRKILANDKRLWPIMGGIVVGLMVLSIAVAYQSLSGFDLNFESTVYLLGFGEIVMSLCALVLIEQLFRNSRPSQRRAVRYLCIGLGSVFAFDVMMFSNLFLDGFIDEIAWTARGYVVAVSAPLVAISLLRSPNRTSEVFISRRVVFYSATLLAAGAYLTVVALFTYYVRVFGGNWGGAAQFIISVVAIIFLFVFVFSDQLRRRLRVYINKHFYANRYDYRTELLRLMETLTETKDQLPLNKRAVKSLAQIVESESGQLWRRSGKSDLLECIDGWNRNVQMPTISTTESIAQFLEEHHWIIEFDEYQTDPERYDGLMYSDATFDQASPDLLIPLVHDSKLLGFVLLFEVGISRALNYEDRDLLKTAAKMVAIQLLQDAASEQLADARQFEAYNKFAAFLMHDLKNLIAQQSLVVENSRKYKDNPEFVDDVIATISSSVSRMKSILDQLQQGFARHQVEKVELGKLVMQAVSHCADRDPPPKAKIGEHEVWVEVGRERMLMALMHAIRNAQDATDSSGEVEVQVRSGETSAIVNVIDNGCGMSEAFIRERLYKPFDSTKGVQGMGIGVYQIRETVSEAGGSMNVQSTVGEGTIVSLNLKRISMNRVTTNTGDAI